jgi:protein-L-isoaspartate O-methyltransferase
VDRGPDRAHRGLAWTGERALPWGEDLQVLYEHYHRYLLVRAWVTDRDVLDLGCGEGYGADLLAANARSVVGIDIADEAVQHAQRRYARPGLRFAQGSITDASSVDADSCDIVVCFEALEHVVEHQELLAVVRKALRPGGLFVTSTPERVAYNDDRSGGENPFHLRELDRGEFAELLGGAFINYALLDQQIAVGSLVTSASASPDHSATVALLRQGDGWVGAELPPATYLLGVASDEPLPSLPSVSVLVDPEIELVRDAQRGMYDAMDQAAQLRDQLATARAAADRRTADSMANADVLRGETARLGQELVATRERLRDADQRAADLRVRVDYLESSRAYRVYRALRAAYAAARSAGTAG